MDGLRATTPPPASSPQPFQDFDSKFDQLYEQYATTAGLLGPPHHKHNRGLASLRTLTLCSNPIGDGALVALLALLALVQHTSALEELHLQDCTLSLNACRAIRQASYEPPHGLRRLMVFLACPSVVPVTSTWPEGLGEVDVAL